MYIDEQGRKVYKGQEALDIFAESLARRVRESRKLHYKTSFQDLPISVENRRGSVRSGVDPDGGEWRTKMKVPYGYIPGTKGADGDALDVFVGPDENSAFAYVVHSNDPETEKFDEDKVMLGFDSSESAKRCFLQHYDDPKFFGGIDEIPMWKFNTRVWVKKETTQKLVASRRGSMQRSILGHHQDIMVDPQVREAEATELKFAVMSYPDHMGDERNYDSIERGKESSERGVKGMKWGSKKDPGEMEKYSLPGTPKENAGRAAAMANGFRPDSRVPGMYTKGLDSVVVHSDGRWTHTSLEKGTTRGSDAVALHYHLKELGGEEEAGVPGMKWGQHKEKQKNIDDVKAGGGEYIGHAHGLVWFNDPQTGSSLALKPEQVNPEVVKAHIAQSRAKFKTSEEHGVKGMKWGIRHERKDAAGGASRGLSHDPATLSMMNAVTGAQARLGALSRVNAERKRQQDAANQKQGKPPKPKTPEENKGEHNSALKELMGLGWKIAGAVAQVAGLGGLYQAITSAVRSPAGQKLFLHTDSKGEHKITSDKTGKRRVDSKKVRQKASVRESHQMDFDRRMFSFLREAKKKRKVYYARSLQRYGTAAGDGDRDLLKEMYSDSNISYPRTKRHRELGMGHFHRMIDEADEVVITPFRRNRVTAGVWSEARHALKKGIPVRILRKDGSLRTVKRLKRVGEGNPAGEYARVVLKVRRHKKR